MSGILSPEEKEFLEKREKNKIKHNEAQKIYRSNNKEKTKDYNKSYNDNIRTKVNELKKKIDIPNPTPINIQQIIEQPKIDKRTRRGKKKTIATTEIIASYLKRKEPLEYSTIDDYIKKADIINRFFIKKSLSQEVKRELTKLFNDNINIDETLILDEMSYINNTIEPTINKLRAHYKNDNTLKGYINVLTVITSHFKTLDKNVYQILTKTNIHLNKKIQEKRELNEIDKGDEEKIIDLDKTTILSNIQKFDNIEDKLIYGLYTLFPSRRLDWRFVKLTYQIDKEKLEDPINNYLILSNPKRIIFNNYKTYKTYGQQDFNIDDKNLNNIIDEYILSNGLKNDNYLFHLDRDRREVISQPNYSKKISNVFNKIYNIPISIRFLRMSWASYLYSKNPTIKEIKDIAIKMAHSPFESALYKKIIKK